MQWCFKRSLANFVLLNTSVTKSKWTFARFPVRSSHIVQLEELFYAFTLSTAVRCFASSSIIQTIGQAAHSFGRTYFNVSYLGLKLSVRMFTKTGWSKMVIKTFNFRFSPSVVSDVKIAHWLRGLVCESVRNHDLHPSSRA